MKYFMGIDTSCYTTSVALVDEAGDIRLNKQQLLVVDKGKRGLRQSEGVFQHLKNLPLLTEYIRESIDPKQIAAICLSVKPRPVSDSYMPVFMVAKCAGQSLANLMGIPYYETSHQENHIMAGLKSAGGPSSDSFLAIHVSGGTSELLYVKRRNGEFHIEILGSTQDLHAGQFVDRIGVALGLPFPCGPHLEIMAQSLLQESKDTGINIPSFVRGLTIGFSGAETYSQRLIEKGSDKNEMALAVYKCLIKTLEKWVDNAVRETGIKEVLLVGGVTSSGIIKSELNKCFKDSGISLYYCEPALAKDNAVGTALLGLEKHSFNV